MVVYLSDLTPTFATQEFSVYKNDLNVVDGPIVLDGVTYPKGVGLHAAAEIRYDVPANATRLQMKIGIDSGTAGGDGVTFAVWDYDNTVLLYGPSAVLFPDDVATVDIAVAGVPEIQILVNAVGTNSNDWADLGDALFVIATSGPATGLVSA